MSKRYPGTMPAAASASDFANGQWVNEVLLNTRLFRLVNAMRRTARAHQFVWKANATAAVSVPNTAWTTVPMGATSIDTWGVGITANGLVIPETGLYAVAVAGGYATSAAGNRRIIAAALNSASGNIDGARLDVLPCQTGTTVIATPMVAVRCTAGSVLTYTCWQDSGAALLTSAAGAGTSGRGPRPTMTVWRWA